MKRNLFLKKIYNLGTLSSDVLDLDGDKFSVIIGKHCIWIPGLQAKIVWTHNGKIEAYKDWDLGRNHIEILFGKFNEQSKGFDHASAQSIVSEYLLFSKMAELDMAPEVDGLFHIKGFISDMPYGVPSYDCKGKYGYFIKDANRLPGGSFSMSKFRTHILPILQTPPTTAAFGDLEKKGNVINGYLIDIRRTIWDMISIKISYEDLKEMWKLLKVRENGEELEKDISELTQFPHKRRKENYQTYSLSNEQMSGSRDTSYRMKQMKMKSVYNLKSVVDMGCNLGAFCFELYKRGCRNITGVDFEQDYINVARRLAKYNGIPINFMQHDLTDEKAFIAYIKSYYKDGVDILLALSVVKHIKGALWNILKEVNWKTCYLESHNSPGGLESKHAKEIDTGIISLGVDYDYLGMTEDRSPRCIWKLSK